MIIRTIVVFLITALISINSAYSFDGRSGDVGKWWMIQTGALTGR